MKIKKIHQKLTTPPIYKNPQSLKTYSPFCYELSKATIKHQRAEEVEKNSYTQQN